MSGAAPAASLFLADGDTYTPTEHTRGPWDPRALHGGAPAALIASAFESLEPGAELRVARMRFQFLRPVPLAPLALSTRIVRPGRRVQELEAELRVAGGDENAGVTVCRASALRVRPVPDSVPESTGAGELAVAADGALGTPGSAAPLLFALDGTENEASFATTAMEMRSLGDPRAPGPASVWMRLALPLLPERPPSPLARLAATADFGNGISATLPFERYLFINADLTIQLARHPAGEWIGLDARTLLHAGGTGLAESVLHDAGGPVGRAFQTLVVEPR